MTSADFCKPIMQHLYGISSKEQIYRPPRVRQITVMAQLCCLRQILLVIMGFELCGTLARKITPCTAFVYLSWPIWNYAFFRFHLAMDTLAVRLTVPLVRPVENFHLLVSTPCRAHQVKRHLHFLICSQRFDEKCGRLNF